MQLRPVSILVLALATGGGCSGPDEVVRTKHEFALAGEELDALRAATQGEDQRCKVVCRLLAAGDGTYGNDVPILHDKVDSCSATGKKHTLEAWDDGQPSVQLECTFERSEPGSWTGWRPF